MLGAESEVKLLYRCVCMSISSELPEWSLSQKYFH